MAFSLHGVKAPHRKNTADCAAVRITDPKTVTLLTAMHIGKPAVPVVKVGDHVDVGTLVARQDGFISSPVYSSVSGKVTKIADVLISAGRYIPAVVIEADGENTVAPEIAPPTVDSKESFIEAVKQSGLVGLGGAGFPTYVKFMTDKKIDYLVINGTECEPYITSDTRTMVDNADDIENAINIIDKYFDIPQYIIGIESNKKEAIAKMKEIASRNSKVSVKVLPSIYPQGGEKVLVYNTTGRVIKAGTLPADSGCIVINCTTLAFISRYIKTGMPLTEKVVTVDGGAVKEPKNVLAPIGTSLQEMFDFCGGFKEDPVKVLYGGPMMGITVPDLTVPVLKQTNAILALTKKETKVPEQTACIRCGTCANTCPLGIDPAAIAKNYELGNYENLGKFGIEVCMECGCCSYNCPASRPLVQLNKMAKVAYKKYKDEKEKEAK
ncbi:MAG: electron transport complex subunit RsxC [Clostridia bacterium]|nr:electron transport complex subunit RsxC [Clostridia bacterium]